MSIMLVNSEQMEGVANLVLEKAIQKTHVESARTDNTAIVITLEGDLGAGKTTLIQHIARSLGVRDVIQSPTFVLMRRYSINHQFFTTLIHIDAYRIEDETEIDALKLTEYIDNPHALICIEWPQKIPHYIKTLSERVAMVAVRLHHRGEQRDIEIE
jgi:tRNA threonylcarbamoyladenosine biosynthesis protein TsaE